MLQVAHFAADCYTAVHPQAGRMKFPSGPHVARRPQVGKSCRNYGRGSQADEYG